MVALREAVISTCIRIITIVNVPSDSPTQTTSRTTARYPTLPNLDVCHLYEQSSYNKFLEDGLAGIIHSMVTSKPKFYLFRPALLRIHKDFKYIYIYIYVIHNNSKTHKLNATV